MSASEYDKSDIIKIKIMEKILRVITLFSGAGGMDLGFIQAGAEILWANDFQKDATITYANNISD